MAEWRIEVEPERKRVRVTTSGAFGAREFRAMTLAGLAAVREAGVSRALVDHRLLVPKVATVDIHDLPNVFVELGVDPGLRIATLIPVHYRALFDYFQALAWNRGEHHFRNFEDEDEAGRWLEGN